MTIGDTKSTPKSAETEVEQSERGKVEAASCHSPKHTRVADRGTEAAVGKECLKDEVGGIAREEPDDGVHHGEYDDLRGKH